MILKELREQTNLFSKKIDYLELCISNDLFFFDEVKIVINEIIEIFVKMPDNIALINTFNHYLNCYNEVLNEVSNVLVEIVEAFNSDNIGKELLKRLIVMSKSFKESIETVINNSVNGIVDVYYEKKIIKNKVYAILYFTYDRKNFNDTLIPIQLKEIDNLKVDLIIIDYIKPEVIKRMLISANYNPNLIREKDEIKISLQNLNNGIAPEQEYSILNVNLKRMDIEYYLTSNSSDLTIISNSCWGASLYRRCGRKYTSPLIWTSLSNDDFFKLVNNIQYYFNCELKFEKEQKTTYPIGNLDDIKINFVHYNSEKEAAEKWYKRLDRVNYENILVQTFIEKYEDASKFENLDFKKKIAFASKDFKQNACIWLNKWESEKIDRKIYTQFYNYALLRSWEDSHSLLLNLI